MGTVTDSTRLFIVAQDDDAAALAALAQDDGWGPVVDTGGRELVGRALAVVEGLVGMEALLLVPLLVRRQVARPVQPLLRHLRAVAAKQGPDRQAGKRRV